MTNYKKLEVWRLAMDLVNEIYNVTKNYPSDERYGLISQTNRAAISIPSNIAEGMGRNYTKDTVQFLHVSRGSAYELETLLNVAKMINIIDDAAYKKINDKIESSIRLINGFINYLEHRK
jgi:four helix bundle protein